MKTKFNFILVGLIFSTALSLISGCSKDDDNGSGSGSPGINEVWMQSNAFNPATRTVVVNTTVTWTNKDNASHTVTSDNGTFTSSNNMGSGATHSYKFTTAGTFNYHCTLHSGMNGKVVVQ